MKKITVLGGTGYVGKACTKKILQFNPTAQVNIISRSGDKKINDFQITKEEFERINFIKGDALDIESPVISKAILESTGIIHSIGTLISFKDETHPESYNMKSKVSAVRPGNLIEKSSKIEGKVNFVYISANKGFPFPLSLMFGGYIKSKREAEDELKKFEKIRLTSLYPGVIVDQSRSYLNGFKYIDEIQEKILCGNKIVSASELEKLSSIAALCALGEMENLKAVYSDNDIKNFKI